eukprot:1159576-Pelagomonas_calceolata.AAC.3
MKDGRPKAEARRRLHAAAVAGARNPHRTIGARVREGLAQLMARKDPAQLSARRDPARWGAAHGSQGPCAGEMNATW